jgi:FkbM family methyltransferase
VTPADSRVRSLLSLTRRKAGTAAFVVRELWTHPANRGRQLHQLTRAVTFELAARTFHHRRIVTLGNASRLWATVPHYSSVLVLQRNPPNWNEMTAWRRHLHPGSLFVDVGANIGVYTLWAAESGARVIAIEPDRDAFGALQENLALNDYEVTPMPLALSDRPGELRLTRAADSSLNHLVFDDGPALTQTVAVDTLDNVLGERTADGVKIDVEGSERLVLEGSQRCLAAHRVRMLQVEWNEMLQRTLGEDRSLVADLLRDHGYSLFRPNSSGELEPTQGSGFGADVFAVPNSG